MGAVNCSYNSTSNSKKSSERNPLLDEWVKLHDSILKNDVKACKEILQSGTIDLDNAHRVVERYSKDRSTLKKTMKIPPLHLSCIFRKSEIVELICSYGADINSCDDFGHTPLYTCIQYCPRVNAPQLLNESFRKRLKIIHENFGSCIMVLLRHGANPSEVIDAEGHSLLHFCAKKGLGIPFQMLMEAGANIESTDRFGLTPLLYGARYGHELMFEFMLSLGANEKAVDKFGNGLLHFMCQNDQISHSYIKGVLRPVHVDTVNKHGQTALMVSAQKGNIKKIEFLLRNGADPSITDKAGRSALFHLLDNIEPKYCKQAFWSLLIDTKQICIYDNEKRLPEKLLQDNLRQLKEVLEHESSVPTPLKRLCMFKLHELVSDKNCPKQILRSIDLNCPRKTATELNRFRKYMSRYWKNKLANIL